MTIATTAILTAIEEVCLGTIGTTETVTAGTLSRGAWQRLDDTKTAADARVLPRFEVEIRGVRDSMMIQRYASHALVFVDLLIRVLYPTDFEQQDTERRSTRATAIATAEAVRAAVTRPVNLYQTAGSVLTGICGGCMTKASTRTVREDFKRRLFVIEIEGRATVHTSRT